MGNTIKITESQFNRLFKTENSLNEIISPLREILKCRITEDRKHITYLGRVYDGVTGEELPLTEQALGITKALGTTGKVGASDDDWSISDILHTGVDIISTAADFIVPGSGAIIDIVHALSYIVEAQFSSGEEKDTLYLMGAITGMFAILPGVLQAVAPILKRFVKTGGKMALKDMPKLKTAWGFVSKNISKFLSELPKWVDKAVNSSIGKRILGKYADKISSAVKNFSTRIRSILDKLKGKTDDVIKRGKESLDVAKTKLDPLKSKTDRIQRWAQQKTSKLIDKFSPNAYSKSNKIISKDGKILDLMTKNGKVNPQALSSINRTGGFDKYKDVLVYDLKTGKLYGRNSKEGIKAIANNTKLLSKKGGAKQISKDVPSDWLKYTKDKVRGVKSVGTSATKSISKILTPKTLSNLDYLKNLVKKLGGINLIPIGPFPLRLMVKIATGKYKYKFHRIVAAYVISWWVGVLLHEHLCELGIKNTSQIEKLVKKSKESNGRGFNIDPDTPISDMTINAVSKAWDLFGLGYFERLFLMGDCNKSALQQLEEFGFTTSSDIEKHIGSDAANEFNKAVNNAKNIVIGDDELESR